ncbi:MAG: hypothetical protein M1826_005001 [Phylliscum demangeonii]|nr:MAG: hypothetical protein M1826_005001 [Phylliscum demangeonii]
MADKPPTPPTDSGSSEGTLRKRVGKACDRCRLKKSKCDGGHPCGRCRLDNAICFFGERKRSQDKVYPKGYVEMLEQQQGQLVDGLQELYRRALAGEAWDGGPLRDGASFGRPLTHDILGRLGVLKPDRRGSADVFEEDGDALQRRLYERGAPPMRRRQSTSSESEATPRSRLNSTASLYRPRALPDTAAAASYLHAGPPTPPPTATMAPPAFVADTYFGRLDAAALASVEPDAIDAAVASMDLDPLPESQGWSSSSTFLAEGMGFLARYRSPDSLAAGMDMLSPPGQNLLMAACGPGDGEEWNDDDDFNALFDPVVS